MMLSMFGNVGRIILLKTQTASQRDRNVANIHIIFSVGDNVLPNGISIYIQCWFAATR